MSGDPRELVAALGKALITWGNAAARMSHMSKCYMNKYAYDLFSKGVWQEGDRPLMVISSEGTHPPCHFERRLEAPESRNLDQGFRA